MTMWPGWPHQQATTTVEFSLPVTADQPTAPAYHDRAMGANERISNLEAEVRRLGAEVRELKQQQQMEVRRPRRHWYQRLTTIETWGDQ
jgi:hypothetical protein